MFALFAGNTLAPTVSQFVVISLLYMVFAITPHHGLFWASIARNQHSVDVLCNYAPPWLFLALIALNQHSVDVLCKYAPPWVCWTSVARNQHSVHVACRYHSGFCGVPVRRDQDAGVHLVGDPVLHHAGHSGSGQSGGDFNDGINDSVA